MGLFNSRFAGFVLLNTTFDELRVYEAELEHMDEWLLKLICRFRYSVK